MGYLDFQRPAFGCKKVCNKYLLDARVPVIFGTFFVLFFSGFETNFDFFGCVGHRLEV